MKKVPIYSVFIKSLVSIVFCCLLGVFLLIRSNTPKIEFQKVTGQIVYLSNKYTISSQVYKDGKERYLQITHSDRIFNIFIGKSWSDFKPEFEIIDSLKIGDQIDLYFDQNSYTDSEQINYLTQYIDKNGRTFFIRGKADSFWGIVLIVISILIALLLILLKKNGKIS